MHDEENGEGVQGDSAGSSYGAAQRGRRQARPAQSRAWALGAVMLTCAVVGTLQWAENPGAFATEMMQRGHKIFLGYSLVKFDPPDAYAEKKMSYVKGEKHMMDDVFAQESSKSEMEDTVYTLVHPDLLIELQHEIEVEMEEEVQVAVKKEQQEYYLRTTATIQKEMGAVMDDVDRQKIINTKFSAMVSRAKRLEKQVCKGEKCENWDALLAGAQKKVDALRKELAAENKRYKAHVSLESDKDKDESAMVDDDEQQAQKMEEDLTYWHGLANVYYAMLHPRTTQPPPIPYQTPSPPPPHCSGLKTIYGPTGSITSGPAGGAGEVPADSATLYNNDCRWVIKSPAPAIVLRFPNLKVLGSEGRISIYVGPDNVALYKNEDVINWQSAYKSFTGLAYPAPIVCHSNEVLVVFHTAASDAAKSEFDMTWTSGIEASAKALIDDALQSTEVQQQLLASVPSATLSNKKQMSKV